MVYTCKRCGFSSHIKTHFKRHLENRKKPCKPIFSNISIETMKKEINENVFHIVPFESKLNPKKSSELNLNKSEINSKSKYICDYCNKSYSTNSNMSKHMKNCKEKKEAEKVKNDKIAILEAEMAKVKEEKEAEMALMKAQMDIVLGHTKEQMDFMRNQIEILMKKAGNTTNTDNSITNNNTNNSTKIDNQINIHINGFGKEDLSYITDRHFREWFNGPFSAIPNLVEYIHFNPKKPQNWNAKIPDDKTSKALIYNAEKEMWVKREKKEVINDLVEKSYNMLDTNFEIQKEAKTLDEKGKKKFENFMKIYDKGDKQLDKRYETEIREKLMNFKEYHR